MLNRFENVLLTGFNILELTGGSSGSYAGRLLACSGATVTKIICEPGNHSDFTDKEKRIFVAEDIVEEVTERLHDPWDVILWDNQFNHDLDGFLSRYFLKNERSTVGVRFELPIGFSKDEEQILQAAGGWMSLTGHPEKEPLRIGGKPASYLVGAHAAAASLLALLERTWREKSRLVNIHALTILVSALEGAYSNYLATGITRSRPGNRHHALTPMAILPCKDGWIFAGAPVDEKWDLLERWAGLQSPPEWSKMEGRTENSIDIERALSEWTIKQTKEELFLTGQAFRMPFSKVQSLDELQLCPQLEAREFWIKDEEMITNTRLPWKARVNHGTMPKFFDRKIDSWRGLRILDLTNMWSGPYCTRILADIGAEVIKVEANHRPDGIRANQEASSPFFRELNRNKRGIRLDLRCDSDREIFLELVEMSDVLVENFSPRVMPNFGLQCEELWRRNPTLTILSLSAFGQTGPYRDFVGYGPTLECMSGLASLTHYADGEPWLPGFSVSDIGAGIHAAFALLAALFLKKREEAGIWIDLSQYETACQFTVESFIARLQSDAQLSATVKDLVEIAYEGEIKTMPLPGGSPVIGIPWSSKGWNAPNNPPPKLGQHNRLLDKGYFKYPFKKNISL